MPSKHEASKQRESLRETQHTCDDSLPRKMDIVVDKEATDQVDRLRTLIKKSQDKATEKLVGLRNAS